MYKTIKCRGFLGCLFSTLVSGKSPKCPPFGVSCSRCLSRILCQADSSRSTTPSPPDPSPGVLSLVHTGSEQVCAQLVSAALPACPPSVPAVGAWGAGELRIHHKGQDSAPQSQDLGISILISVERQEPHVKHTDLQERGIVSSVEPGWLPTAGWEAFP